MEEKEPWGGTPLIDGHLHISDNPRGLATPKGVTGEGDSGELATPVDATPRMTQETLGSLNQKVRWHRARIDRAGIRRKKAPPKNGRFSREKSYVYVLSGMPKSIKG